MAPMPSKKEMKEPLGPKLALWGIFFMIMYLVFVAK